MVTAGRRVTTLTHAPRANGAELRAVFERWHSHPALDHALSAQVDGAREAASAERDTDPRRG